MGPASGPDAYKLLDAGERPSSGFVADPSPNGRPGSYREFPDLGPPPPGAREVAISVRSVGIRSTLAPLMFELIPRAVLPARHRFLLTEAGRVRAEFLTGDALEGSAPLASELHLARLEYPEETFVADCVPKTASLVYRVDGYGVDGATERYRLFWIWSHGAAEGPPEGFTRASSGLLELGQADPCGVEGVPLVPSGRPALVLRERAANGTFGPPIRISIELPPR